MNLSTLSRSYLRERVTLTTMRNVLCVSSDVSRLALQVGTAMSTPQIISDDNEVVHAVAQIASSNILTDIARF
jgi:hypothetical protein